MGAWGYAVFDDDTAYDALDDLRASPDIAADMERPFDAVLRAEYVGYDEGHCALVAAAVLDSALNGTAYRCDEEGYPAWVRSLKDRGLAPLRQKAAEAVEAVLSDRSELKELWAENAALYGAWRADKRALQERLR